MVGIVLELQRDCLESTVPASSILRKAKVIAAKLELNQLKTWLSAELEGYNCAPNDLPEYRKGIGQPKFNNPYNGWCPIMTDDGQFGRIIRTVFFMQPIAELEELAAGDGTLIMYYNPTVQETLQRSLPARMECGLHFSKTQIKVALDYVRNKTLDWTLELEGHGILGDGFTFGEAQKNEAKMVTNHIYGGNIGVVGDVEGDAVNSGFLNNSGNVDFAKISRLADQIEEATPGLPRATAEKLRPSIEMLRSSLDNDDGSAAKKALTAIRTVLEGAGGSLVASAILAAIGAS